MNEVRYHRKWIHTCISSGVNKYYFSEKGHTYTLHFFKTAICTSQIKVEPTEDLSNLCFIVTRTVEAIFGQLNRENQRSSLRVFDYKCVTIGKWCKISSFVNLLAGLRNLNPGKGSLRRASYCTWQIKVESTKDFSWVCFIVNTSSESYLQEIKSWKLEVFTSCNCLLHKCVS